MRVMKWVRRTLASSQLQPEGLFVRTLQGPPPNHVKLEKSTGRYIMSSQAFKPSSGDGKVSGDLAQLLETDDLPPTALYPAVRNPLGAAAVSIGAVRELGCDCEHSPMLTNWYHGGLTGIGKDRKHQLKRALVEASFEIIPIDQDEARRQEKAIEAENERIRATEAG